MCVPLLHLSCFCALCCLNRLLPNASTLSDIHGSEYKKINPLGKIPALVAGDQVVVESEVINEYLEDAFPAPKHISLLPACPLARSRTRTVSRVRDLYMNPHSGFLFTKAYVTTCISPSLSIFRYVELPLRL